MRWMKQLDLAECRVLFCLDLFYLFPFPLLFKIKYSCFSTNSCHKFDVLPFLHTTNFLLHCFRRLVMSIWNGEYA